MGGEIPGKNQIHTGYDQYGLPKTEIPFKGAQAKHSAYYNNSGPFVDPADNGQREQAENVERQKILENFLQIVNRKKQTDSTTNTGAE